MTVDFVRARLAVLQRQIPGITWVHDRIPHAISNPELPCFVNRAADALYSPTTLGETATDEGRLYYMELYVTELQTGGEGQAEDMTTPFLDVVRDFFLARPQLQIEGSNEAVYKAVLESDTGPAIGIRYPNTEAGTPYAGIRFSIRIHEIHPIAYIG